MTDSNYPSATPNLQSPSSKSKNYKNLAIGLLAAGLLGTWGYLLYDKNKAEKSNEINKKLSLIILNLVKMRIAILQFL